MTVDERVRLVRAYNEAETRVESIQGEIEHTPDSCHYDLVELRRQLRLAQAEMSRIEDLIWPPRKVAS